MCSMYSAMEIQKWPLFSLLDPCFVSKIKIACVFGTSGNEAMILTRDDEVFTLGTNVAGCLTLSDGRSSLIPEKVESLSGKNFKGFSFGSGPHVLAFTECGDLYSWGHNGYCELGSGTTNQSNVPTLVSGVLQGKIVVDVATGSHHSLALTNEGEVFSWGQNSAGQVGSGVSTNQSSPKKVNSALAGKVCVAIACGQTMSAAITDNGEVYTWGYNGVGQLGIDNSVNQPTPCRVSLLQGIVIVKIMCGQSHCLALSDMGQLYAWGANSFGQVGTGKKSNISKPVHINAEIGRVVDIAANHYSHTSAAMTQNCKVYMWGQCRGQNIMLPILTPFSSLHDVFAYFSSPCITYKAIEVENDCGDSIATSFKDAFDDSNTSDLTITVNSKKIYVHKAILKIRCEHFRLMFQDHWQEDKQSVLEMDQFSYEVYRAFLQYLYTDEVVICPEGALELLVLASAYCENRLKKKCEQIIKQGITVENAASLYSTAIEYQAKELEEFCFKFFLNHMTAIIQTEGFSCLDVDIIKNFMKKAAQQGAFKC